MDIIKMVDQAFDKDSTLRVLVYGAAGTGKTTLYGSFPKPMLVFDFDDKLKPIYGVEGIDVLKYSVEDAGECTKVFTRFNREWKEAKNLPYKTIVVDSLTSFDTLNLRHFVMQGGAAPDAAATLPVYGGQSGYYSTFLSMATKNMAVTYGKNVIIVAHECYFIDKESGVHRIMPLITGSSIMEKLPSMFEEVWYLTRGEDADKRFLHYNPYKKAIATSCLLKGGNGEIELPDINADPSAYDVIMKKAVKK